ncbi:YggS family pyridoxal phosphate-dependent enzyme [Candidatus Pacearchaeota archaeon]|nr:YggS family pyridoxal phosphate-dependent enzyme [Candidatus Pacearchaeota archaeon]
MFNKEKYQDIIAEIPSNIKIVGVTKAKSPEEIKRAIDSGIKIIGENYIQEAKQKYEELKNLLKEKKIEFHLIGHLQSNKVKDAAEIFDCIQTIDSKKIAHKINESSKNIGKIMKVMIQVNLGEKQKSGIKPEELSSLIQEIRKLKNLELSGIMAIPEEGDEKSFELLKELKNKFNLNELSLGMSQDYKLAILKGSTMIRLGTILFGERSY